MRYQEIKFDTWDGIHCKTSEQADTLCNFLGSIGVRWHSSRRLFGSERTYWNIHKERTCYLPSVGCYSTCLWCRDNGGRVWEFDDIEFPVESYDIGNPMSLLEE